MMLNFIPHWIFSLTLILTTPLFSDPVICIHGFLRSSSCMKPIAQQIENMGHTPILWDYPSRQKTIEGHAEDLVKLLQEFDEPCHFVTHSLGGVVVRAALNHPNCPERVKGGYLILMAPPNQGSQTAHTLRNIPGIRALFGSKAGKQLLHYGPSEIEALGPLPPAIIIAGSRDWKVFVAETVPKTAHTQYVIPSGHCFIMKHPDTIAIIRAVLSQKNH